MTVELPVSGLGPQFADVASEPDIIAGRNALLQEGNQPKNNDEPAVTDDLIGKLRG